MKFKRTAALMMSAFILTGCGEDKPSTTINLDELKGPAAILVDTWREQGFSDDEILEEFDKRMSSDGTELYYDNQSKDIIQQVKDFTPEGTNHSLAQIMALLEQTDLLTEEIVWVDSGVVTSEDFITENEQPLSLSKDMRLIGISENSEQSVFKLLLLVDDEDITIYKVKANETESFNADAELALQNIYDYLINPNEQASEEAETNEVTEAVTEEEPVEEATAETSQPSVNEPATSPLAALDEVPEGALNAVDTARTQITYLISYYLDTYVNGDTASLEFTVHPSTEFYYEQVSYIDSLYARGITMDLLDFTITAIEPLGNNQYTVTVNETYAIHNPTTESKKVTQTSYYSVALIDGEFYITNLAL